MKGHLNIVEFLLEKNAELEAKDEIGETSLICAPSNGHLNVVRLLLEKNAD